LDFGPCTQVVRHHQTIVPPREQHVPRGTVFDAIDTQRMPIEFSAEASTETTETTETMHR
jgi:hypothetical protein